MSVRGLPSPGDSARDRRAPQSRTLLESHARRVVDYALVRRTTLTDLATGRVDRRDVCDAQAYLIRAARYHGEPTGDACPVCKDGELSSVCFTYGDNLGGTGNGRARPARQLADLAAAEADFTVYLVEVCAQCRWNHLLASYVLGTGEPTRRRARS